MALPNRIKEILEQAGACFQKKASLDSFWQRVAELYYPERATFTSDKMLGEGFCSENYASEQIIFRRDFGNFIGSAIRPKGREWFEPRLRREELNDVQAIKAFLKRRGQTTRNFMYDPKSRFTKSNSLADQDWVTFGNSVQMIEERPGGGLLWRTYHLRDCAWEEDFNGEVNTMYRRFKVPAISLLATAKRRRWTVSNKLEDLVKRAPKQLVSCMHVLMPIDEYDYTIRTRNRTGNFVSLYIDCDHAHEMSNKQVAEFNYVVSRWLHVEESPYAFSPCVCASLPDVHTLQEMVWSILQAGEKAVLPPLVGRAEAILGGVNVGANDVTWIDSTYDERMGEALRPLELGENPNIGEAMRAVIRQNLSEAFYANKLFLPTYGPQMTAEEVMRRTEEFLRTAQPIIEPAENERNGNQLDLTVAMLVRMKKWGDPKTWPHELLGEEISFTYDNPIEDARRQAKIMGWQQVYGMSKQAIELDPVLPANINLTQAYRDGIAALNEPTWLFPENEAEDRVKQASKEMDMRGAAEEVGQGAMIAEQVGKAKQALEPQPA